MSHPCWQRGLAPDNYRLTIIKGTHESNPMVLALTPRPQINYLTCDNDANVIIGGRGFSSFVAAANSGTNVTGFVTNVVNGQTVTVKETAAVSSWTDERILCRFSKCPQQGTVAVNTVFYTLNTSISPPPPPPTFSPRGGAYLAPQNVVISTTNTQARIRYTTDGTTPTAVIGTDIANGSTVVVDRSLVLKAVAYQEGSSSTKVVSETYSFRATIPVLSPLSGTFSGAQSVSITSNTPDVQIRYTTDGSTLPTETVGTLLVGNTMVVDRSLNLKAVAYRDGWTPTTAVSATYTLKAATPALSPAGGTYITVQNVTITSATTGALISYTTDGSTPSQNNGTVIGNGDFVLVDRSLVIKAVAFKPGWAFTAVVSAAYTLKSATQAVR